MLSVRTTLYALVLSSLIAGPAAAEKVCYFGVCKDVPAAPAAPVPAPAATPPVPQTSSALKVLATFGSWEVVVDDQGRRAIRDTFDDGSSLVIAKVNGEFDILIREPTWHLHEGSTADVKVDIDGDTFTGTSSVLDGQTIAIVHLSAKFVKSLYHGNQAHLDVEGVTWTLSLDNAANAIDAAAGLDSTV